MFSIKKNELEIDGEMITFYLEKSMKYAAFADDYLNDPDEIEIISQFFDEEITPMNQRIQ